MSPSPPAAPQCRSAAVIDDGHDGESAMPIYEFNCCECGHRFEELVLRRDEKIVCPKCDSAELSQLMSTFSHSSDGSFTSSKGDSCSACSKGSCAGCSSA